MKIETYPECDGMIITRIHCNDCNKKFVPDNPEYDCACPHPCPACGSSDVCYDMVPNPDTEECYKKGSP